MVFFSYFFQLFRNILQHAFTLLKKKKWRKQYVQKLTGILSKQLINSDRDSAPDGIKYHMADLYLPELTKTANEQVHLLCM